MKIIRISNEAEMILEFLKGELDSKRFSEELGKTLKELRLDTDIIRNGDISNREENLSRLSIMKLYRGYPDDELFESFPAIYEWKLAELDTGDIDNIYYIDYDYWNELSGNTSKPTEAAKTIRRGIEIYGISNQPSWDGLEYLKNNRFPPVILITCSDEKYLIIEGHSRMTVYGLAPDKLNGTYAYIGYCTSEEMEKYDPRMLSGENVKSRKY